MATPNVAGYIEAQNRLIDTLGADVTFIIPTTPTWPSGTQFDPESGQPFDPTIEPASAGSASASVKATIVEGGPGLSDDVDTTEVGRTESIPLVLKIKASDRSRVEGATHVTIWGRRFVITEMRPKGLIQPDSYFVYTASA